jgi:hypothetical protein
MKARHPSRHIELSGEHISALMSPCVYIFLRAGRPLYVGSGTTAGRPFQHGHQHHEALRKADRIIIRAYPTKEMARRRESYFIVKLKPLLNDRRHTAGEFAKRRAEGWKKNWLPNWLKTAMSRSYMSQKSRAQRHSLPGPSGLKMEETKP